MVVLPAHGKPQTDSWPLHIARDTCSNRPAAQQGEGSEYPHDSSACTVLSRTASNCQLAAL